MAIDVDRMLADAAAVEEAVSIVRSKNPFPDPPTDLLARVAAHVRTLAEAIAAAEAERNKLRLEVTHWPVWKAAPQAKPACWDCDCHRVGWFHGANGCCARCGCCGERAEKSDLLTECTTLRARIAALEVERDRLQRFKDWVHSWLSANGVPEDPDPEKNAATGCRIGGRLEHLKAKCASGGAEKSGSRAGRPGEP